ncbi:MAG: GNAT family N-acetyltransferase [Saprospiraceae bacterium]|jgi:predicted GNAT family N-acyltransferase
MQSAYYCSIIDFGTPEFDEALKLRNEVLRKPLNMVFNPEDIATEYDSFHIGCYTQAGELMAVLTLKPVDNKIVKMRQVAVDPKSQSKGLGTYLVHESEKFAVVKGFEKIELHARDTAVDFYKKSGYIPEGEIFKEVGIDHLSMYKILT